MGHPAATNQKVTRAPLPALYPPRWGRPVALAPPLPAPGARSLQIRAHLPEHLSRCGVHLPQGILDEIPGIR